MAFNSIGGQSGFSPAQAAAQYYKNYGAGTYEDGKISQATKRAMTESSGTQNRPSPLGTYGGSPQPTAFAKKPSSNPVVFDPRDPNGDGIISFLEDRSYAARRFSAQDDGRTTQARKEPATQSPDTQNRPSPIGTGREEMPESGESEESTASPVVSDPRDTNGDGKVSLQEEIAYAAKRYSSRSVNQEGNSTIIGSDRGQGQPNSSINLMA